MITIFAVLLGLMAVFLCWKLGLRLILLYVLLGYVLFTYQFLWAIEAVPGATVSTAYSNLRLTREDLFWGYSLLTTSVALTAMLAMVWSRVFKPRPASGDFSRVQYGILAELLSWVGLGGLCYFRIMGASSLLDDWGRNWVTVPFAGVASFLSNGLCLSSVFWVIFIRRWKEGPRYLLPLVLGCIIQLTSGTAGYVVGQISTLGLSYLLRDESSMRGLILRAAVTAFCALTVFGVYRFVRGVGAQRAGFSVDTETLRVTNSFTEIWAFTIVAHDAREGTSAPKRGLTYLPIVATMIPSFLAGTWKQGALFDQRTEIVVGREYIGVDVLIPATVYGEGIVNYGLAGLLIPIIIQAAILGICEQRRGIGVWNRVYVMFVSMCVFTGLRDGYAGIIGNILVVGAIMGVSYGVMRVLGLLPKVLYPFAVASMVAILVIILIIYWQRLAI